MIHMFPLHRVGMKTALHCSVQWNIMGPSQVSNIPFEYIHAGLHIVCMNARLEMIIQKAHMPSLIELAFCRLQFHAAVPFVSIKNVTTKERSRFLQSFFFFFLIPIFHSLCFTEVQLLVVKAVVA